MPDEMLREAVEAIAQDLDIFLPAIEILRAGQETSGDMLRRVFMTPATPPDHTTVHPYRLEDVVRTLIRSGTYQAICRLLVIAAFDTGRNHPEPWVNRLWYDLCLRLLAVVSGNSAPAVERLLLEMDRREHAEVWVERWVKDADTIWHAFLKRHQDRFLDALEQQGFRLAKEPTAEA